jgi:hypothetical protein
MAVVFGWWMMRLGADDAPCIVIPDGDPEPILPWMALWFGGPRVVRVWGAGGGEERGEEEEEEKMDPLVKPEDDEILKEDDEILKEDDEILKGDDGVFGGFIQRVVKSLKPYFWRFQ